MSVFHAQSLGNKLSFGTSYNRERFLWDLKENPHARYRIERITPENRKVQRFYHGACIPLWAFLNGLDYRDGNILGELHAQAKREFNGDMIIVDGNPVKIGLSTKGKLRVILDKFVDYLEENYAIDRDEVLNNEKFKYWRDVIFPGGGPDNYIDYLVDTGKLKRPTL